MVAAVLTRRAGVNLSNQDIITNVVGGMRVSEPAADVGVALAIASSFRDCQVAPGLMALGEVGLSGEVRPVRELERRVAEAARLGFKRCLVPATSSKLAVDAVGVDVSKIGTLAEALRLGLVRPPRK